MLNVMVLGLFTRWETGQNNKTRQFSTSSVISDEDMASNSESSDTLADNVNEVN